MSFSACGVLTYSSQIGKGAAGARGDDTKTLKSAILDWICPKGEAIQPPLHRNSKIDRGFNHELTGSLLCPAGLNWNDPQYVFFSFSLTSILTTLLHLFVNRTKENLRSGEMLVCGDQWPIFLYAHQTYDPEDPWCGLLRSRLLVSVGIRLSSSPCAELDSTRLTSMCSHLRARLTGNRKPHGQEMLDSTA
jgi:hypothetical protein